MFLAPDGNLLTGQRAWQDAATQPDRFIPAPRRSPEQQLTVAAGAVGVLGHTPHRREAAFLRRISLVMGQRNALFWDLPAADAFAAAPARTGDDGGGTSRPPHP
ncbi:hypothetical protein [Micromonospora sp. CA-244673]|uniref:hypothetical protein n=1 Tax=Micromonospora sp. CA-244673 TaxID=3239958 RepID=UPI003D8F8881